MSDLKFSLGMVLDLKLDMHPLDLVIKLCCGIEGGKFEKMSFFSQNYDIFLLHMGLEQNEVPLCFGLWSSHFLSYNNVTHIFRKLRKCSFTTILAMDPKSLH